MILYNITVIVDTDIEANWLHWINHSFVPQSLSSNLLVSNRILKVLDSPNEGATYCLQFIADNMNNYTRFRDEHATLLLETQPLEFRSKSVFFTSVMEFIDK